MYTLNNAHTKFYVWVIILLNNKTFIFINYSFKNYGLKVTFLRVFKAGFKSYILEIDTINNRVDVQYNV